MLKTNVRRRSVISWWCVLVAFALPSVVPAADRPIAPRLLPDTTFAYFQIASTPDLIERFRTTGIGRLSRNDSLKPLLGQFWKMAADAFQGVEQEIGAPLDELLAIAQGEVCLAVVAPPEGALQTIAWLDCGDKLPTVRKLLARIDRELANRLADRRVEDVGDVELVVHELRGGGRMVYLIKHETLLIATNLQLARHVLALWNGEGADDIFTLADNRKFTSIMNHSRTVAGVDPQIAWYVDPIELSRRMGRGNFSAQAGLAILESLGLTGIKGLGGTVTFATDDFDSLFHVHLLLEFPRHGVVNALAMQSGDVRPEPWVPSDVESYTTMHWDAARTYDEVVRLYELFRGGEGAWDAQVLAPAFDRVGLDLERDLVRAMAGRMTMVTWMERPLRLNSQATLVGLKLRDTKATRKVLERVAARFPDQFKRQSFGGVTYFRSPLTPLGRAARQPDLGQQEELWRRQDGCVAVLDDYLLIANSEKLIRQAIVAQNDPVRKLANELDYKIIASKIQRQLGSSAAGMVAFRRPEEGMRHMYELATSEAMRARLKSQGEENRLFKGVDDALTANPLPPFSVIAQYLSPRGSLMTNDDTGFHYMTFSLPRDP